MYISNNEPACCATFYSFAFSFLLELYTLTFLGTARFSSYLLQNGAWSFGLQVMRLCFTCERESVLGSVELTASHNSHAHEEDLPGTVNLKAVGKFWGGDPVSISSPPREPKKEEDREKRSAEN